MSQTGVLLANLKSAKGVWTRQVIGVGNFCPSPLTVNYIALRSTTAGTYHYYLDNIIVRKADGGIRSVIWQSAANTASLLYRYKNVNYNTLSAAKAIAGFPFSELQVSTAVYDAPPPASGNLVQNFSFENGASSWTLGGSGFITNVNAQDGDWALRLVNYLSGSTRQTIAIQTGTTYEVSVWVDASAITSGSVVFDTFDKYDETGQFVISGGAGWTNCSGRFVATNTSVMLRLFANAAFAGTAYFDHVSLQAVGSAATPYSSWSDDYGLTGGDADQTADPDGDSANNFYEYVLGGNPTNGTDAAAIEPVARLVAGSGSSWLEYVYNRRKDAAASGLTYALERRGDLLSGSWSNIGTSAETGFGPKDAEFDSVTNQIPTIGKTQDFIRLKISEN